MKVSKGMLRKTVKLNLHFALFSLEGIGMYLIVKINPKVCLFKNKYYIQQKLKLFKIKLITKMYIYKITNGYSQF